jgi:hypothetical protein
MAREEIEGNVSPVIFFLNKTKGGGLYHKKKGGMTYGLGLVCGLNTYAHLRPHNLLVLLFAFFF